MSRITKTIAESVAIQLAEPKKVLFDKIRTELNEVTRNAVIKHIPKEVMETYKKFPKYFKTHSSSNLVCTGFNYESYGFGEQLPDNYDSPKVDLKDGEKILAIAEKLHKAKKDYNELKQEIEIALVGLRTYNNVEKEFPEAFKLLPNIVTTALTVDLKSIRCKLDKKNCK